MAQAFVNIVKKEETTNEAAVAKVTDSNDKAKEVQGEAQKKGTHGEDFCCGSCS